MAQYEIWKIFLFLVMRFKGNYEQKKTQAATLEKFLNKK